MAANNQRDELHKTIWRIANDLRGSVDGWDFKQYVLDMLFYRYVSENLCDYINEGERESDPSFDYATMSDDRAAGAKEEIVSEKGYFILPSQLFANVLANARHDKDLNITLENVFNAIEGSAKGTESEGDLEGLFQDFEVNNKKLGNTVDARNDKLAAIMEAIGALDLGTTFNGADIDTFGDAYEYLMAMYASNAGKSGGEYFTPQCVSELLARLAIENRAEVASVYDPACGSGSLLLRFAKILGEEHVGEFYGQEKNLTTYNLCRMNMFLHNIPFNKFHIAYDDTLIDPHFTEDAPFECIVSNPPYSTKWEGDKNPVLATDPRFTPAGVLAPPSKSDLAFTMHMLSMLKESGTAAIVEFPGVLYRGGKEKKIREYLLKENYVDTVIQLPADLFYGTTIATCILVLKKAKTDTSVLFVDASQEFVRRDTQNVLTEENRTKILDAVVAREDVEYFCAAVDRSAVLENDANLSVSSYVEKEDTREKIDIKELNTRIEGIVAREAELRAQIDAIIADLEGDGDEQ